MLFAQAIFDPEAKALLDKISKDFDNKQRLSVDFDLIITLPESKEEVQKGSLIQSNNQYRVVIANQEIINNGKEIYIILKDQKIAQLNSASSMESNSQDMLNPRALIKLYQNGEYEYAIVGQEDYDGKQVTLIEFKPKDKFAEYSKLRIAIDKTTNLPKYFKIFSKDGSRYTLKLKTFNFQPNITLNTFKYIASQYPGIKLEDLRID